jgi:hypothetical protein
MSSRRWLFTSFAGLAAVVLSIGGRAAAVTLGTIDDFQMGTTAGWAGGATLSNAANAGPMGAGDGALSVAATSGRVAIVNTSQWTGDFAAAGIRQIVMDVRHANAFPLQLRIGLASGVVGSGGSGDTYVSADAVAVANDGLWHRVALGLSAADFLPHPANSNPAPSAAAALASVSHFRILHNPAANFLGANGPATFFLDNIRAVPEPAGVCLWVAGMIALGRGLGRRRRGRRSSAMGAGATGR